MYEYDESFYQYINSGAVASADVLVPLVQAMNFSITSVLDVGCGAGAWLSVWKKRGVQVLGLDGEYIDPANLLVDSAEFRACNVAEPFDLKRDFDLVQCLEVAEHIDPQQSEQLVDNLCRHSNRVLFSAAPPGQGGENHINEKPYSYWRDLFAGQGYQMYDVVRPRIVKQHSVMPWYRYNVFLFIEAETDVSDAIASFKVAANTSPMNVAPAMYRLRCQVLRLLPTPLVSAMAIARKVLFLRFNRALQ